MRSTDKPLVASRAGQRGWSARTWSWGWGAADLGGGGWGARAARARGIACFGRRRYTIKPYMYNLYWEVGSPGGKVFLNIFVCFIWEAPPVEQSRVFYSGRWIPPGGNVFLNKFICFIAEESKTENFIT